MDKSGLGVSIRKPVKTKTFRRLPSKIIMKPNNSSSSCSGTTTTTTMATIQHQHQNPNNYQVFNSCSSSSSTMTDRDRFNCSEQKRQKLDVKQRPPDGFQLANVKIEADDLSVSTNSVERTRTVEDFLYFCDVVLKYTNYPHAFLEEEDSGSHDIKVEVETHDIKVESPLNSIGESAQGSARSSSSISSNIAGDGENEHGAADYTDEDDSWHQVTCWCGKPFAGRPMIECESCFVWLHLTCARVRKANIPEHFKCSKCKPPKTKRKRQVSGNSEGDSPGTSNNGLLNHPAAPGKASNQSFGLHPESLPLNPGGSSAPSANHSDFRRNSSIKSPLYYSQSNTSNGNNSTNSPSKTAAVNRRLAKPRPRRPAIASSSTNSFENPTLLPLRLTITTSHNPPPFS